ncbi:MAG TPA: SH3 domain-containing protein, partial [Chloroflexaceae bacterium]|nr:SH3 domain-containing protein [Chloroflexaceae bacterium]
AAGVWMGFDARQVLGARDPEIIARVTAQACRQPGLSAVWQDLLDFAGDEIYIVNIAEGLNLRSEPDATDTTNVIAVVPNGAPVVKLEGPRVEGNIPWLRVRAEVGGRRVEGWMSLNYLLPKE